MRRSIKSYCWLWSRDEQMSWFYQKYYPGQEHLGELKNLEPSTAPAAPLICETFCHINGQDYVQPMETQAQREEAARESKRVEAELMETETAPNSPVICPEPESLPQPTLLDLAEPLTLKDLGSVNQCVYRASSETLVMPGLKAILLTREDQLRHWAYKICNDHAFFEQCVEEARQCRTKVQVLKFLGFKYRRQACKRIRVTHDDLPGVEFHSFRSVFAICGEKFPSYFDQLP